MKARYVVTVPPTAEQGSYKTIVRASHHQSHRAAALQDYNSARAHDGLPQVSKMPAGTKYARISVPASIQITAAQEHGARVAIVHDGGFISDNAWSQ